MMVCVRETSGKYYERGHDPGRAVAPDTTMLWKSALMNMKVQRYELRIPHVES